jgi:CBS domain-containing protein
MVRRSWRHGVRRDQDDGRQERRRFAGARRQQDRGIVTERDYARNVFLKGRASPQTLVGEIMAHNVVCVKPDKSIEECMAIMSAKRVRHLPVINDGELLGIVSIGDLVKSIISDREFAIEQLEHYISGAKM